MTEKDDLAATPKPSNPNRLAPGRYDDVDYSITLPFLPRPTGLDGSHAGDFGFDPLGFSDAFDIYYMQECELRHARLAMLAVAGWPLAELLSPKMFLTATGQAPSVLNGFNPITFLTTLTLFAALGFFEFKTAFRSSSSSKFDAVNKEDMADVWEYGIAGDYGFDPANLYNKFGDDPAGRKGMRQLEITQGRYAMLGITGFALIEKLTNAPIVDTFGMFFHPNALLPILGFGYWVWSNIYEVSDLREYPIRVQYKLGGEETLRVVKSAVGGVGDAAAEAGLTIDKIKGKVESLLPKD